MGSSENLFYAIIFVSVVTVIIFHLRWQSRLERKLPGTAKLLGLEYSHSGSLASTVLSGQYRNIPTYISEEIRGSGRSQRTFAIYQISLKTADVPPGLVVFRQGLTSVFTKAFGQEDIQIDNPSIDNAFIIQGTFAEDAREFFARPNVEEYFLELLDLCSRFRLENNFLILEFDQRIAVQQDLLRTRLEALSRCAHAISQTDPKIYAKHPTNTPQLEEIPQQEIPQQENTNVHW